MTLIRSFTILAIAGASSRLTAQSTPNVRRIGPVLATSTEALASVSQIRTLPGGRVIVNDTSGRRLILFDSLLRHGTVIADSKGATGVRYPSPLGGLIAYRGDSSLFADPYTSKLFLLDGAGKVVRMLEPLQANQMISLMPGPFGAPGVDAEGRLVFRASITPPSDHSPSAPAPLLDSALIVRFDLVKRKLDTAAKWRIPSVRWVSTPTKVPGGTLRRVSSLVDPLPWTDDWAILSDGTIAIVRGRDYRADFIDGNNKMTSKRKIPFKWEPLSHQGKLAILDSVRTTMLRIVAASIKRDSLARAASGRPWSPVPMPTIQLVTLNEMPEVRPAFRPGSALGDADGNLWIRTSKILDGGVVYDVINKRGVLIDRVLTPPRRVIAGFGRGGIVYMCVADGDVARLERARLH